MYLYVVCVYVYELLPPWFPSQTSQLRNTRECPTARPYESKWRPPFFAATLFILFFTSHFLRFFSERITLWSLPPVFHYGGVFGRFFPPREGKKKAFGSRDGRSARPARACKSDQRTCTWSRERREGNGGNIIVRGVAELIPSGGAAAFRHRRAGLRAYCVVSALSSTAAEIYGLSPAFKSAPSPPAAAPVILLRLLPRPLPVRARIRHPTGTNPRQ